MSGTPFKRLILRAVLRDVYPLVIRLVAVPDHLDLADFDDIFHAVLGWDGGIGYSFQVHGEEFNSFRRKTRSKKLRDFRLHRQEKFLYTLGAMDQWEWELRVIDLQEGEAGDEAPVCVSGRGAAPPQYCGGPTGYRLMLKRQKMGDEMCPPDEVESVTGMLAAAQSDGGEDVRRVQAYMQPGSEHWIDWFHITMRLTVLQQQTKSLRGEAGRTELASELSKRIDSVKHLLWHGNVAEALDRQASLLGVVATSNRKPPLRSVAGITVCVLPHSSQVEVVATKRIDVPAN